MSDVELQSALLLIVPAAEPAVGAHRARLDASARDGVPAHFTVLYPFLPPAEIGPGVLAELSTLFAGVTRFSFSLDQVRWFGDSVVWLGPSDESPFRSLTGLAGGGRVGPPAAADRGRGDRGHVDGRTETGTAPGSPGNWHRVASFPLG